MVLHKLKAVASLYMDDFCICLFFDKKMNNMNVKFNIKVFNSNICEYFSFKLLIHKKLVSFLVVGAKKPLIESSNPKYVNPNVI